jgi:hypothetical protein
LPKPQLFEGHPDADHPMARRVGDYIQFEGAGGSLNPTLRDALESLGQAEEANLGYGRPDCRRMLDKPGYFRDGGLRGGGRYDPGR